MTWLSLLESKFDRQVGSGSELARQWLRSAINGVEEKGGKYYQRAQSLFPVELIGNILDAGCGDGEIALGFALNGSEVVGVDADSEFIEVARLRAQELSAENVEFRCADLCNSKSIASAEFDLVLSIDVIEHVNDASEYLAALRNRLRPAGRIWLFTPNRFAAANILADPHYKLAGLTLIPNSWAAVYATKWRRRVRLYEVAQLYTFHSLKKLANSCGLDISFQASSFWTDALNKRKWLKLLNDLPIVGPGLFSIYQYRLPTIEAILSHRTLNGAASG